MKFIASPYIYVNGNRPRLIVIHDMEYPEKTGSAEWCANYFKTSNDSAHYCVDNQEIVQAVREQDGAWHAPGYIQGVEVNRQSIGIEHAGYAKQTRADWLDPFGSAMLSLSAQLTAGLCQKYGIPAVHLSVDQVRQGVSGICGHDDITRATGSGDHMDPGAGFPWDTYIAAVQSDMGESLEVASSKVLPALLLVAALGGLGYVYLRRPDLLPARLFA